MSRHRAKTFSLVELMAVVAIIMILAAVAIPLVQAASARAKLAELPICTEGIATAHVAYIAAMDASAVQAGFHPDTNPGKTLRPWTPGGPFAVIDWAPDGQVRGSYQLNNARYGDCDSFGSTQMACSDCWYVEAWADVDQDGTYACGNQGSYQGEPQRFIWRTGPSTF